MSAGRGYYMTTVPKIDKLNRTPEEMMKLFLMLTIAILASCNAASAQMMSDCPTIRKSAARLACYDKITPPVSGKLRQKKEKLGVSDDFAAEEQRMKRVLRPICKNC
jgi:hypothetical protein